MATDDIFNGIDDDKTVAYIKNSLPQELKDKFDDDTLYYFLDAMADYYESSGVLEAEPDKDGFIDVDLDEVVDYVIKAAKRDKVGDFEHDEILFVVQAEMDYAESEEE